MGAASTLCSEFYYAHLVVPVPGAHEAGEVWRHQLLLVVLDPLLRPHGLHAGQHQVVVEGEGAGHLGHHQPHHREPPEAVQGAHLGHGVAQPQRQDVSKHVDFRVSLIELRGAMVSL